MNGVNIDAKPDNIAKNNVGINVISVNAIVKKISRWYLPIVLVMKFPIEPI